MNMNYSIDSLEGSGYFSKKMISALRRVGAFSEIWLLSTDVTPKEKAQRAKKKPYAELSVGEMS